jgi:hypothetical protein
MKGGYIHGKAKYGSKQAAECERGVASTPSAYVDPHGDFPVKGAFGKKGDDYTEVCEVDPITGKVRKSSGSTA